MKLRDFIGPAEAVIIAVILAVVVIGVALAVYG